MTSPAGRCLLAIGLLAGLGACDSGVVPFGNEAKQRSRVYPPGTAGPLSMLQGPDQNDGTPFERAVDCSISLTMFAGMMDQLNIAGAAKERAALRTASAEFERRAKALAGESQDIAQITEDRRRAAESDVPAEMKLAVRCLNSLAG